MRNLECEPPHRQRVFWKEFIASCRHQSLDWFILSRILNSNHHFVDFIFFICFVFFIFISFPGLWAKGRCPPPLPALRTERRPTTDWAPTGTHRRAIRLRRRPVRPHPSATLPTVYGDVKFTSATLKAARKSTQRVRTSKLTNERIQVRVIFVFVLV